MNSIYFFVFVLLGISVGQVIRPVYVAYDSNVDAQSIQVGMELFRYRIKFTTARLLDITNVTAVSEAVVDMHALYLCPGTTMFPVNGTIISLIEIFVQSGGILLFSPSEGDVRSQEVSIWLNDPVIQTTSKSTDFDVETYYYTHSKFRNLDYYFNFNGYNTQYRGKATNESLTTAFGRGSRNQGGLPWQWFSPDMYWISGYNRPMMLTPSNEEFCMFKREGPYGFYYSTLETCFLFSFPHGSGYVVEISTNFTNYVFDETFIETNIRIIETALQLNDYHPIKNQNVILSYYSAYNTEVFSNLAYDLSTGANVFVWRDTDDITEFNRLLSLTGANTLVLGETQLFRVSKKSSYYPYVKNRATYQQFIYNGGNIVRI